MVYLIQVGQQHTACAWFQPRGGARKPPIPLVVVSKRLRSSSHPIKYITSKHIPVSGTTGAMAESKPNSSYSSDEDVKAPNIFERAKEEFEAVIHTAIRKEKHRDIDESTPLDDVKAPNVFERVKEEIEALVETIHQKQESHTHDDERDNSDKEQTKHDKPVLADEDVKAPNIFERAKEEIEAVIHTVIRKEKHKDIDESTPLDDVKAPNVFERVKEEIEALVETIHQKKESRTHDDERDNSDKEQTKHHKPENGVKSPLRSVLHHEKSPNRHHDKTHRRNDDIDETTPLNEVKAPNVFERAEEEIEAIVGTIHPKIIGSNDSDPSSKEEGGFKHCLGVGLEKVCHPFGNKKD